MNTTVLRLLLAAATLLVAPLLQAQAHFPKWINEADLRAAAVASFPEYFELLALPNVSSMSADLQKNAVWLEGAFRKRGFTTLQLENKGKPFVYAEYPGNRPGRKTVLFYIHFDGQPVIPAQWSQKDPWQAVVKQRGADGTWTEVDRVQLLKPDFDPELRVFGRSTSDDKGPILMFLAACDLLASRKLEPAFNVKVLLDSEEEVISPGMAAVMEAHPEVPKADALVLFDGPLHESNRPTLLFGCRGNVPATITVYGPRAPLHNGHYGNYVPNPAQRLAQLLASMKADDGRVTIPGFYDRIALTPDVKKQLAEVPDDEALLRKRLGVAAADHVGATYQEALQYPGLEVVGLAAAGVGEKRAGIIPSQAVAELGLRTVPEAEGAFLVELIRKHIEAQGFHLVQGAPTDAERASFSKLAQFKSGYAASAARTDYDTVVGRWAGSVLEATSPGTGKPIRIRAMGGSMPIEALVAPTHLPFVVVPLANADNNQHAFDENLRMGNYLSGMKTILGLLTTPYPDK